MRVIDDRKSFKLSRAEHEQIVKSKVLSFMLTSPLDTVRQNALSGRSVTAGNIMRGMCSSFVASSCISVPCHSCMMMFDRVDNNLLRSQFVSLALSILVANVFKVPAIYYHKRFQNGLSLGSKVPPKLWSNVMKISIIEDWIEEGTKNYLSKRNLQRRDTNPKGKNLEVCGQALMLFMISYPFDVMKNGRYYSKNLRPTKNDFLLKALHKNIQNIAFLKLLHAA